MKLRSAAWLCLMSAAACSHNNPEPTNTAYDAERAPASSEPALTPASLEASRVSGESTSATAVDATAAPAPRDNDTTTGQGDVRAPILAESKSAPKDQAHAPGNAPSQPPSAVQPDNTKVNQRDTSSAALTPPDQRENETDLKITQHVRQAVMADGSLSFTAKNVKIITQGGKVTLRGPVKSAQERDAIDAAARKVAGVTQVDNQIEVKK